VDLVFLLGIGLEFSWTQSVFKHILQVTDSRFLCVGRAQCFSDVFVVDIASVSEVVDSYRRVVVDVVSYGPLIVSLKHLVSRLKVAFSSKRLVQAIVYHLFHFLSVIR